MTGDRAKLLIIDDEPANLQILGHILRDEYDIVIAVNGTQAIKRAIAAAPNLILLDIRMDGMDGYEVCQHLKNDPNTSTIPIIFVTAMTDEDDEVRGLELGAVDYISKPYRPAILKARVRIHLELERQRVLLDQLSAQDCLTGLSNRRGLEIFLEQHWRHAVRYDEELSIIFMDIDCFKQYNDNYGHVAGDQCLKEIAGILTNAINRSTDLIARYGGEEFVCVLPKTDLESALKVAERLRSEVLAQALRHEFSSAHNCVTLSFGVTASYPAQTKQTPSELLIAADKMLYQAKQQGRNRIVSIAQSDSCKRLNNRI